MDATDKKRRPYPSAAQKAKLVSCLESDVDLSNGKYSATFSKNEAERRWSEIADELNTIPGVEKTWLEWRKTWQDMKCSSKKKGTPKDKKKNICEITSSGSMATEDLTVSLEDSLSADERPEVPQFQDLQNTPKLILELDGNGTTVSVPCAKKEDIEDINPNTGINRRLSQLSSQTTFLNNRRYSYDYFCQDNICRLCWSTKNSIKNIKNEPTTAQNILEYIGVDVTIGKPTTVCSTCIIKIESFIKFKRLCLEANRKLTIILHTDQVNVEKDYPIRDNDTEKDYAPITDTDANGEVNEENVVLEDDSSDEFLKDNYCSLCNQIFESTDRFIKHNYDMHKIDRELFECARCNLTFGHKLKLCRDTMDYSCDKCCCCIPTRRVRCEKVKPTYKKLECHICSEVFEVHLAWKRHMAAHRKEMKFVCETCGRVLKNKKSLSEHMLIHTSNKQLKCPHCDYRATLKTSLVYHIRLHTGERPYACDRCPYTCVTSSNLRRHINTTHLGIRAFKCQICGKEYMYKRSLKEHITATHQGRKENMCKRCGALYFRFEHLRKHILIKHRKVIKKVKDDYFEVSEAGYKRLNKYKIVTEDGSS